MREDLRHYIDTAMDDSSPAYKLLGDGISSLTEEMNPTEESKHYINMSSDSNSVKSYQRTFEADKEDCDDDDEMQAWFDKMVDTLPTGAKAKTTFVRFRLRDVTKTPGTYKAIKVPCTVSVTSSGGDGGDYVHNVINVKQCGDDIVGTFNVSTSTFTPGEAE